MDDAYSYLAHAGAHYSKNWNKAKQKEYNHWYYENKIKKGQVSKEYAENYAMNSKKNTYKLEYGPTNSTSNNINTINTFTYDPKTGQTVPVKNASNSKKKSSVSSAINSAKKKASKFVSTAEKTLDGKLESGAKEAKRTANNFVSKLKKDINKTSTTTRTYKNKKGESIYEKTTKSGPFVIISKTERHTKAKPKTSSHGGYTVKTYSQYGTTSIEHIPPTKKKKKG